MDGIKFIDLFSGGGGFTLGLEAVGMNCIGHAEIDKYANLILEKHWPSIKNYGDVSQIDAIESCDIVVGGSPCQDISIANRKGKGLQGDRSSLFHKQVELWKNNKADLFLWENVRNALSSNKGNDFSTILSELTGSKIETPIGGWRSFGLAYGRTASVSWRVINSRYFGIPQSRERVYVFADKQKRDASKVFAIEEMVLGLHPRIEQFVSFVEKESREVDTGLVWSRRLRSNWAKRNYIGTLTAHESKDYHTLVERFDGAARKLTENEAEALMGWPKNHTEHDSVTWMSRYKILGNGVTPPVIAALGKRIKLYIKEQS